MTATGFLTVAPVVEGSMARDIAKAVDALEDHPVRYETTAMGTVIEAESADELFAAAESAHDAVDADRVSSFLKIDDKRASTESAQQKVEAVEAHLGREAKGGPE